MGPDLQPTLPQRAEHVSVHGPAHERLPAHELPVNPRPVPGQRVLLIPKPLLGPELQLDGQTTTLHTCSVPRGSGPSPRWSLDLRARSGSLIGHGRLGEPGVALHAVERAAEYDLRDSAPDVGERGPELVLAHRRIRLPRQHRLVKPATAQIAAEFAYLRDVKAKLLLARGRPPERALAVSDKAV